MLRGGAAAYVRQYADRGACPQVQSTLAKLSLCRTRALGGKTYECDQCGDVSEVFHSCGDRHCPQCSGRKRYDFAERAEQLILESVTYYQVVLTLPGILSEMALANRDCMADLLFTSAWKSLRKTIRMEQDYDPASMIVLHTWNQRLQPHWHVHALVPGGGPSLSGNHWKQAEAPPNATNSDGYYLAKAEDLRETFRKFAIAHLKRLYKNGELKLDGKFAYLQDEQAWKTFCDELAEVNWVSFIQPPPNNSCSAEQVVRYLTRYLTGGPISDGRITEADTTEVTFMAREGKRTGGEREQVPVTLSTLEFIRRWCDHIQPDQLTKTRYFGGWSNQKRGKYLDRCRSLLGQNKKDTLDDAETLMLGDTFAGNESVAARELRCPKCEQDSLRLIREIPKPRWDKLLNHLHEDCPDWYGQSDHEEFCRYLDREYGIGYEDWYAECAVESAMKSSPVSAPPKQLCFAGFSPDPSFVIESF